MNRIVLVLLFALGAAGARDTTLLAAARPAPDTEVRGLWVLRSSLTSPEAIDRLVSTARDTGFNTLLVQVRGRGEAYYASAIEPRAGELMGRPDDFDPLARVLDQAHAAGLRVHAWVNVNLVASATTPPRSPEHVAQRHPEWLMVPRALAKTLARQDARSPGYFGALSRWSRAESDRVEGLYLSPLVPAAQDYTAAVIEELVSRYPIDGLHLDYIRYPSGDFDYGQAALAAFRAARLPQATAEEIARLDAASLANPAAWADTLPESWAAFRRDRLTALVTRLSAESRVTRPTLVVSAAVVPNAAMARAEKLQDWAAWAADGHLDVVCPMIYTTSATEFAAQVKSVRQSVGATPLWAGIGAYRLTAERTATNIRAARAGGAAGILLFSYDSLIGPAAPSPAYLTALRPTLLDHPGSDTTRR
jgi:uncharacterized lipoprotein YddW (UPF0748 family)